MATALIVLAAGQGTRMNSDLPKVLHELGGLPLFAHALASGASLAPERAVLVAGHGADAVTKAAATLDAARLDGITDDDMIRKANIAVGGCQP